MEKEHKVLITGSGRCGTTFLMGLLTELKLDTGYDLDYYEKNIFKNCNAGLEDLTRSHYIIKDPNFCVNMNEMNQSYKIDMIYVPMRNIDECTNSRVNNGNIAGGLIFGASDFESQKQISFKMLGMLLNDVVINDIPVTYLSFTKMTTDSKYLYNKLQYILSKSNDPIDYEYFNKIYNEVSVKFKGKYKS